MFTTGQIVLLASTVTTLSFTLSLIMRGSMAVQQHGIIMKLAMAKCVRWFGWYIEKISG